MRHIPAWVRYTVYRVLFITVPLVLLLLLGVTPLVAVIVSVILAFVASIVFLRGMRREFSAEISAAQSARRARKQKDADPAANSDVQSPGGRPVGQQLDADAEFEDQVIAAEPAAPPKRAAQQAQSAQSEPPDEASTETQR